jgi:methyl-accepting chemotaxis protein WspA
MLKNSPLERRLLTAFGVLGFITVAVAVIGLVNKSKLSQSINTLANNSLPSVVGLWKVNEGQTQIESAERALVNPKIDKQTKQAELERIRKAWEQIDAGFKQYEKADEEDKTTTHSEEEDRLHKQLETSWATWKRNHEEFLQLYQVFDRDNGANAALLNQLNDRVQANRASFEEATKYLLQDIQVNEKNADAADQAAQQVVSRATLWLWIGLIGGSTSAFAFAIYFSRTIAKPLGAKIAGVVDVAERISTGDLTTQVQAADVQDEIGKLLNAFRSMTLNLNTLIRQVQQSGIQITTSATQIAASGRELEATVTEQVASTNEVAATAKQIAVTATQLVRTVGEVEHTSQATAKAAGDSQQELLGMEVTMRKLADATSTISAKLGVISEKANNINSIVTTITKVADQTNLLSLNAAIEAEKAGEYGMGFAVVAREIRRLADQTAVATLDIESMVREMQVAVSTGVMEMDKFTREVEQGVTDVRQISTKLESIIDQVQTLTPRFEEVSEGMEAQSQGAQQISDAMLQLTEAASQTAESLREINHAIEQLSGTSQGLRQEISHFKVAALA